VDFEAIKFPLVFFLVGLLFVWTLFEFYRNPTKDNAENVRFVAGQSYLFVRAVIVLAVLAISIGVIQWLT
jgi:hypothetical protein